jgi:hypothetical protein
MLLARHKSKSLAKGGRLNVQTALSQKADYRVTMEFDPLTAVPAI